MFNSMMRLVEQQLGDGAVRRPEFDLPNPAATPALPTEGREALIRFIIDSTPERHRFVAADGRQGVVYFDRRGRAVSGVLDTMEDDEITWIAMSRGPKPMGTSGGTNYPAPVQEDASSFQLTPKSRTAIEKFVFSNLPPDNKMRQGGKMIVMLTGKVAEAASVESYTRMDIAKVPCARLVEVARTMGYTGPVEKVQEGLAEAETKTFKLGTFLHLKTQTWEGWFYPLDDQKNGGLTGLQFDMEPGAKPKGKPKQKSLPSSHRRDWKEGTPPPEVVAKFEAHPDFKAGGSAKVEDMGPVHVSRDFMDPTISIYWVAKSDMTEDEFAAWLRKQHVRSKIQREKDRYSATTQYESVITEGTGLASVTSKKTGKTVNGEVGKMSKSSISITDNLGKSHVFDRTDPDIAVQFY